MRHERHVHRVGEALIDTQYGEFRLIAYESEVDGGESHMALVRGDIASGNEPVLVRMHSHCLMGDVFGSTGCDCHATIEGSMQRIAREGRGALIYLHQTSKGFSVEKLAERTALTFHREKRLPALPESERKTQREIGIGAQILLRPEFAADSSVDQPSSKSCRVGRIRYRDCGTDSGAVGAGGNQRAYSRRVRSTACDTKSFNRKESRTDAARKLLIQIRTARQLSVVLLMTKSSRTTAANQPTSLCCAGLIWAGTRSSRWTSFGRRSRRWDSRT